MNKSLAVILGIMLPFILLMTGVRLIMTPAFPALEYQRPGFPADPLGMSISERKGWSAYAVRYLTNDAEINYLADLKYLDGSSLYNTAELEHMVDVKRVVHTSLTVWYVCLGIGFACTLWLLVQRQGHLLLRGINAGAWLSVILIFAMIVYLLVNFNSLFDTFHKLFFADGTWVFNYSDTLIRLFPLEFWRDAFFLVGAFTLLSAWLLIVITRRKRKTRTVYQTVPPAGY